VCVFGGGIIVYLPSAAAASYVLHLGVWSRAAACGPSGWHCGGAIAGHVARIEVRPLCGVELFAPMCHVVLAFRVPVTWSVTLRFCGLFSLDGVWTLVPCWQCWWHVLLPRLTSISDLSTDSHGIYRWQRVPCCD
jgi:hypothetical protein